MRFLQLKGAVSERVPEGSVHSSVESVKALSFHLDVVPHGCAVTVTLNRVLLANSIVVSQLCPLAHTLL